MDRALRDDDSLFTPGEQIWSSQWLGELRERFLEQPAVERESDFLPELERQLAGSPPEVYQVMAEALYVHYLIQSMRPETKLGKIQRVLGWSPKPVSIPQPLITGLQAGFVNATAGFANKRISYQFGTLIESVEQWKELDSAERDQLLINPWVFKEFLFTRRFTSALLVNNPNTGGLERHLLLHIVYPDSFEAMLGTDKKNLAKAKAFSRLVTDKSADPDRTIKQIRKGLEARFTKDIHFYGDEIRQYWKPKKGQSVKEELECEDTPPPNGSDLNTLAGELFLTEPADFLHEIETLLVEKKQVIFQGPPGTGKTFVAQKLARHLAGSEERVTLVQFHPSYAYEDFVQGFRPTLQNGKPGFELRDGPLMRAARAAREDSGEKHFLIIDEINRGQIAKVLGELYFLLEYRDREMNLQYSDKPFSLPENLYIIGTMNTADRSIALVDLALRRRFYFVEFHPDDEPVKGVLRRWLEAKASDMEWVADVVERANELLEDDRHAAIGPSYFMKDGLDDDAVERIWTHSVLPYIEERLYGDGDRVGEFDLSKLMSEVSPLHCIVDGLSRLVGISREEASSLIESEGGATQGEISSHWQNWHAAFRTAGLRRITLPKDGRPTLSQLSDTTPTFIARVRMHLVTVIDGEAFEACGNRTEMDRKPNHYWLKDDGSAENGDAQ